MPSRRARSDAVSPSLFFAVASAPCDINNVATSIARCSSSGGSHMSGVCPGAGDLREIRLAAQQLAKPFDVPGVNELPDVAAHAAEPMLPRQRVLHVTQGRFHWRVRQRALKSGSGSRVGAIRGTARSEDIATPLRRA